ncbi:MAG TPA: molybdenum ABC transporter ATP-binding protein, partial [Desulfovibrio sp.]|nr:molybdenum ABC transporter ATP-binding protein [Desulfovibrio sp.]
MIDIAITHRLPPAKGATGKGFKLDVSFATEDRTLVLFGHSGSGKTLTLQAIAGLMHPRAGRIVINGATLLDTAAGIDIPARNRGLGYVFQDYALFPHLSVRKNVEFG